MINVVIIEDELPARRKLIRFLSEVDTPITILAKLTLLLMPFVF